MLRIALRLSICIGTARRAGSIRPDITNIVVFIDSEAPHVALAQHIANQVGAQLSQPDLGADPARRFPYFHSGAMYPCRRSRSLPLVHGPRPYGTCRLPHLPFRAAALICFVQPLAT